MSKKSQEKSKLKKDKKPPPTWREQLAELDINKACESRTCQVVFMAELTLSFSEAVTLFHMGANNHPSHFVKSINFENLMRSLQESNPATEIKSKSAKQQSKNDKPPLELLHCAAQEAKEFLSKGEALPTELIAQILKIKIIQLAFEDVLLRNEERKLEEPGASITPEKSKKDNVLKKAKGKHSTTSTDLPPEERTLYIILNGFYDPDLPKQLFNVGVYLIGVLELSSPEIDHKEKYVQSRIVTKSLSQDLSQLSKSSTKSVLGSEEVDGEEMILFINPYYHMAKNSTCFSMFNDNGQQLQQQALCLEKCNKIKTLYNFWNTLYKHLEGEYLAEFLENTAHMRVFPQSAFLDIETAADLDDERANKVFLEISEKFLKIFDVKEQHTNYLQHLNVVEIEPQLEDISAEAMKTYSKLMNAVPLDCFTVELFINCIIEEVSNNLRHCQFDNNTYVRKSMSNTDKPAESSQELNILAQKRKELVDYILHYRKMHFHCYKTGIICHEDNAMNPKKDLKIINKRFPIYESNELEFKANTYEQLSSSLLKINSNFLRLSIPVFLWQLYPSLTTIEVIYRNHQLQTWNQTTGIPLKKLRDILNIIEYENIICLNVSADANNHEGFLHDFLPKKDYSEILRAAVPKIKYMQTPDISLTSATNRASCVEIPQHQYENHPNIYEAKNALAYLWHEKLPATVMLQCLKIANSKFACLDHKYCTYTDSLILRYHNDVDEFGINCKLWSESIRTPVCFRDFCKYVVHEDAKWLEREGDKLKQQTEVTEEPVCQSNHTLQHSESEDASNFFAYNFSTTRLQLTESTTRFHSMDGYSVTIDRAKLLEDPSRVSVNLEVLNHNLILHYRRENWKDPLIFHFSLEDGTIIAFAKPSLKDKPEVSLVERVWKKSKTPKSIHRNSAYHPHAENYRYTIEEKCCRFKEVQAPNVASESLNLPQRLVLAYLEKLRNLNLGRAFKAKKRSKKKRTRANFNANFIPHKKTDVSEISTAEDEKIGTPNNDLESPTLKIERDQALEQIKEAKKLQIPLYKICSSKLHQFKYVKPIKSHIHMKIGKHEISMLCKHPRFKTSRHVQIVKAFPVKLSAAELTSRVLYNMKLSLPSGLLVYTTAATNGLSFNVKQRYIEKGPQCNDIADEYSRSFLRSGQVVVRRVDGSLDIYSANGEIAHCEIPYSIARTRIGCQLKNKYITQNCPRLFKRQKILCRSINRNRKHHVGNSCLRNFTKKRKKNAHSLEFTIVSHDGRVLKVTKTKVKKLNKMYQNLKEDTCHGGYTLERNDGTLSVLCEDGLLITHFKDQTRITSWYLILPDSFSCNSDSSVLSETSLQFSDLDDWVIVEMYYKYEHPNYASVMLNSNWSETEIKLPNDVVLNITDDGNYFVDVNGTVSSIVSDEMVYVESRSCDSCMQRSITVLNVHPLYKGLDHISGNTELLKTCDSYEKVFVVNYDGRCFRNSNFIKNRINRAECRQHDKADCQQFFVLNRDLSGSKMWDINAFRRSMMDATEDCNSIIQCYKSNTTKKGYTSVEVRTSRHKPYHEYFLNRRLLRQITHWSHFPPFTTFFHLYALPHKNKIKTLRPLTIDHHRKGLQFPMSDNCNVLCNCTSQISKENFKLRQQLKSDVSEAVEVSSALSASKKWWSWYQSNESLALKNLARANKFDDLVPDTMNNLSEIRKRISSINRWSESSVYLDNLYVLGEDSESVSDVVGSISDWVIKSKSVFSLKDYFYKKQDVTTKSKSDSILVAQEEENTIPVSVNYKLDRNIEKNILEDFYKKVLGTNVKTNKICFQDIIQSRQHPKNLYEWIKCMEQPKCVGRDKCEKIKEPKLEQKNIQGKNKNSKIKNL